MPWYKVDDAFPTHPKNAYLDTLGWQRSSAATRAWLYAGCWCQRERRERRAIVPGRVPMVWLAVITKLPDRVARRAADDLVASGLWERPADDGYQFHDFDQYQPDLSAKRSEAGSKGGRPRKHPDPGEKQTESNLLSDCEANGNQIVSKGEATTRAPARARRASPDPVPDPVPDPGGSGSETALHAGAASPLRRLSDTPLPRPLQRRAFLAYEKALSRNGGTIASEGVYGQHFRAVGDLAERYSGTHSLDVDTVLDDWAGGYCSMRRERTPEWWLEWCTREAGRAPGTRYGKPSVSSRADVESDPLPEAGNG